MEIPTSPLKTPIRSGTTPNHQTSTVIIKERSRIIKAYLIFTARVDHSNRSQDGEGYQTPKQPSTRTSCRVIQREPIKTEEEDDLDQSAIALMCLPDGFSTISPSSSHEPHFHSFLVTRQDGSRLYGSSLLVFENDDDGQRVLRAYCLVASIPFVSSLRNLLSFFLDVRPDPGTIGRICKLRLPSRGKCLRILLPRTTKDIYIYRGTSDFPLLDYPLRELLLNVLSPENVILALSAVLLEFQVLVISRDYYNLMMVSESLTSLLSPFNWHHVYVPILPTRVGLHYLDAPTPYIMGINTTVYSTMFSPTHATSPHSQPFMSFPSLSSANTARCKVFCDENRVEVTLGDGEMNNGDLQLPPPFLTQLAEEIDTLFKTNVKLATMESRLRNRSEALEKVAQVARKHQLIDTSVSYLDEMKLNHLVRLLCRSKIEGILLKNVDKFVVDTSSISPLQQGVQHSTSPTSSSIKFDAVSFLSDQPDSMRPFIKRFLETQMFASFVDQRFKKVVSKSMGSQSDDPSDVTLSPSHENNLTPEILSHLEESVDSMFTGAFEDATIVNLNESDISKSCSSPRAQRKVYTTAIHHPHHLTENAKNNILLTSFDGSSTTPVIQNESILTSPTKESMALASQTNVKVVESLLREARTKTKRILLEKMGTEEGMSSHAYNDSDGIEGNALIASLCDLTERIWIHGRNQDLPAAGSALWSMLINFVHLENLRESMEKDEAANSDPKFTSVFGTVLSLDRILPKSPSSPTKSSSPYSFISRTFPSYGQSSSSKKCLESLPISLLHDIQSIQRMTDIKTDVGKSRAFLRLSLERKLLSQHLKTLLSRHDLSTSYRKYSFLRSEEEREQFLTHLLTLNAVDLLCFTNTFTTSFLTYRFFVHGSGPFTGFFCVSGTLNSSGQVPIEGHSGQSFLFHSRNLGLLKFLTLSSSFTSKVYVDYVVVRNEETGHVFKFLCGKWFGRSVDDEAMERVLLAVHIADPSQVTDLIRRTQLKSSSIGRNWTVTVTSPTSPSSPSTFDSVNRKDWAIEQLQIAIRRKVDMVMTEYLKDVVDTEETNETEDTLEVFIDSSGNNRVLQQQPKPSMPIKQSSSFDRRLRKISFSGVHHYQYVNELLLGEDGVMSLLRDCLYVGFKNRIKSPFRKQIFLWDYILRIQLELKLSWKTLDTHLSSVKKPDPSGSPSKRSLTSKTDRRFIELVDDVSTHAIYFGKDSKVALFLLLSMREKLLSPHFLRLLSWPSLAKQFYDHPSFVTDPNLIMFLIQLFSKFNQVDIPTDPCITKGL